MKYLLLLACLYLTNCAVAQQRDTIYLKRPNQLGHSIFIDTNPNSVFYNKIANMDYTLRDSEYRESINRLNAYKAWPTKPIHNIEIPRNWCKLHLYQGKYYLYAPSDWSDLKISLNDSVLFEMAMEKTIYANRNISKIGPNKYRLAPSSEYDGSKSTFEIYIFDPVKAIAVFKHVTLGKDMEAWTALMVDINKIHQFPIIVNYTPQHKDMEFRFDEPDYGALLSPNK